MALRPGMRTYSRHHIVWGERIVKIMCDECARLQREYSAADRPFLEIARKRLHRDSAPLEGIDELYRQAGERRKHARRALQTHQATHMHPTRQPNGGP